MKKWNVIALLLLMSVTSESFANEAKPANQTALTPAQDTLVKRHPLLAMSAMVALRQIFGHSITGAPLATELVDYADFSGALVGPSAFEDSQILSGAALLIISPFWSQNGQIAGHIYSAALSQFNGAMKGASLPLLTQNLNNTRFAPYANTTQHAVPALVNGVPFLAYYLVKGSFDGVTGTLAKGAGFKTVYVLMDGVEQINVDILTHYFGDKTWVKPVAQLETGLVLSVSGYTMNAIAAALKNLVLIASKEKSGFLVNTFGAAKLTTGAGLFEILSTLAGEVAGFEIASSIFSAIEKRTPKYASYVNPVLGAGLIGLVAHSGTRTWLSGKHRAVQLAALGASLSGFIQVLSAMLSAPGWIEEIPAKAWNWMASTHVEKASKASS